jgi:hypothetical protein
VSVSAMEKLDNLNPKISLACHVGIRWLSGWSTDVRTKFHHKSPLREMLIMGADAHKNHDTKWICSLTKLPMRTQVLAVVTVRSGIRDPFLPCPLQFIIYHSHVAIKSELLTVSLIKIWIENAYDGSINTFAKVDSIYRSYFTRNLRQIRYNRRFMIGRYDTDSEIFLL